MNTDIQAFLDQKFEESYLSIEKERKRSGLVGKIELFAVIGSIVLFLAFMKFMFWGSGFNAMLPALHKSSLSSLIGMPGPQSELIEKALIDDGYVSLVDYGSYVEMANEHKALIEKEARLKQLEEIVGR